MIEVNMPLLERIGLRQHEAPEENGGDEQLPCYFHVIETQEKITLFNHQFVVWIVPKIMDGNSTTVVMIALITEKRPHLEVTFYTQGAYNTSKFVLRVLKHYLSEVIDTEEEISSIIQGPH